MNISLETGKLRDTHSEGKVRLPFIRELWTDFGQSGIKVEDLTHESSASWTFGSINNGKR
jgi:hypothetical protein